MSSITDLQPAIGRDKLTAASLNKERFLRNQGKRKGKILDNVVSRIDKIMEAILHEDAGPENHSCARGEAKER